MALKEAVKEQLWLETLYSQLEIPFTPGQLFTDSQSAIQLAKNPEHHSRIKYINIQYYFIRENVQLKRINLTYIGTDKQLADALIKAVSTNKFTKFIIGLNLH